MYRFLKIPKEHLPEIISDISDDKLYTLIIQDRTSRKIKRKTKELLCETLAINAAFSGGARFAWEGYYTHGSESFKNIIDKNIPCTLMHKVKNEWAPEVDTIVCFMTGDTLDVFLVHPKDLTEWDPNEV